LAAVACAGEAAGPRTTTDLLPEVDAAREAGASEAVLDLWLAGEARVELALRDASAGGSVLVERDGEEARAIPVTADLRGVDLPAGPGAVRLRLPTGAPWTFARLVEPLSEHPTETAPVAGASPSARGRDVVLILCDSLAAAHLSSYGNPRATSPNLDGLAARGVRFQAAYSQTAWTLPSVSSLFTSVEQERHGVVKSGLKLGPDLSTLAELFRAAGYRTVGRIQNGTVGPHSGLGRGFDEYVPSRNVPAANVLEDALDELAGDAPVFLYVHLLAPHMPYEPSFEHRGRFDPDYAGQVDGSVRWCARIGAPGYTRGDPDAVHLEALYDEMIATVDAQIGAFLDAVDARGLANDTLFVFVSDHGEAFLQHGRTGHGPHVFDEMVRVPLILAAPGAPWSSGAVVHDPVSLLDVLPTLAELCGLPAPRQAVRGTSLVPALAGASAATGATSERALHLTARYGDGAPTQSGLRLGRHKWVRDEDGVERLFDLADDPGERTDLAARRPILAGALERRFERWRSEALADADGAQDTELDAELRAELEAIGYAGEDDE